MHRREHQERELGSRGYIVYFELYIANLYRPASASAYFLMEQNNRIKMMINIMDCDIRKILF